jgi:diguanylate cyclase (GGDEF)-like protein
VALLPLIRRGELIGSLNLGSRDAQRYARGKGTEFLQRLAAVVAIALENTINHERLKLVGLTDPLTRVNNRRFFDQRLNEEIAASQRSHQSLACMFLDVDHFKRINDSLGHQAGDMVLCEIAKLVRSQLRSTDILCRYGGEEFVVLLPNTGSDEALDIAERIRGVVEGTAFSCPGSEAARVTISIGVAARQCQLNCDVDAMGRVLVASADGAVYQAKESGRNQVIVSAA